MDVEAARLSDNGAIATTADPMDNGMPGPINEAAQSSAQAPLTYATTAKILANPNSKSAAALRAMPKFKTLSPLLLPTQANTTVPPLEALSCDTPGPAATSSSPTAEEHLEEPNGEEEKATLKESKGKQPLRPSPYSPTLSARSQSCGSSSPCRHRSRSRRRWQRPRKKRNTEDELVVLTERGLMVWDLGPMSRGRRGTTVLDAGE
jgi:hypothetical protein